MSGRMALDGNRITPDYRICTGDDVWDCPREMFGFLVVGCVSVS